MFGIYPHPHYLLSYDLGGDVLIMGARRRRDAGRAKVVGIIRETSGEAANKFVQA